MRICWSSPLIAEPAIQGQNFGKDGRLLAKSCAEGGVRNTVISGSRQMLQMGVRQAILEAAQTAGINIREVGLILASGMITSNVGLCEVPHVIAPAGTKELARGLTMSRIEAVVEQPIWFVPGIKNNVAAVDLSTYEAMDIMRGEEVETFGLIEKVEVAGAGNFCASGIALKVHQRRRGESGYGMPDNLSGRITGHYHGSYYLSGSIGAIVCAGIRRAHVVRGRPLRQSRRLGPGMFFCAYPGVVQRHQCQSAS